MNSCAGGRLTVTGNVCTPRFWSRGASGCPGATARSYPAGATKCLSTAGAWAAAVMGIRVRARAAERTHDAVFMAAHSTAGPPARPARRGGRIVGPELTHRSSRAFRLQPRGIHQRDHLRREAFHLLVLRAELEQQQVDPRAFELEDPLSDLIRRSGKTA